MRKIHYLIAVFALFLIGGATVTMIKAKDMVEVLMSLIGMFEGVIIFFIFERIDNKIKQKV
jgi:NADH:ubiquinone oxidoreductase subunit K